METTPSGVEAILTELGFEPAEPGSDSGLSYDLIAERAGQRFVVASKKTRDLSTWALGEPILRLVALSKELRARPLLVVLVGALPSESTARAFAERLATYHLEGLSWLLVGRRGGATGSVLGEPLSLAPQASYVPPTTPAPSKISFTDSAQWLLKHLLLGASRERWWSGDTPQAIANANKLAEAAGVSPATAYRVMRGLEAAGYVVKEQWGESRLEHPEALIEEWTGRYRITDNQLLPYGPDPYALSHSWRDEVLRRLRKLASDSYALTAYAASEVTRTQRTRKTITLHLYVQDVPAVAAALDLVLEPNARGRDLVYLIQPAFPQSVFRGASTVDGLRVVDPLQCYLDLYHHYDAGREQADYLFDKVIAPRLEALLRP